MISPAWNYLKDLSPAQEGCLLPRGLLDDHATNYAALPRTKQERAALAGIWTLMCAPTSPNTLNLISKQEFSAYQDFGQELSGTTRPPRTTTALVPEHDVVIERLTLQLYSAEYQPRALQAVANRLASPGIFFSQSHDGCWKPPSPRVHRNEWWFRAEGWPIWPSEGPLATRVAWLLTTTG